MSHTVGNLKIAEYAWERAVAALVEEYQCDRAAAELQLRVPGSWDIGEEGVSYAVPVKYLLAVARDAAQLDAYLGFGAHVVAARSRENDPHALLVAVVEIPAEHAQWQAMRLQSGLLGGIMFEAEQYEYALAEMEQRAWRL